MKVFNDNIWLIFQNCCNMAKQTPLHAAIESGQKQVKRDTNEDLIQIENYMTYSGEPSPVTFEKTYFFQVGYPVEDQGASKNGDP